MTEHKDSEKSLFLCNLLFNHLLSSYSNNSFLLLNNQSNDGIGSLETCLLTESYLVLAWAWACSIFWFLCAAPFIVIIAAIICALYLLGRKCIGQLLVII
jgi:hypothetical protein